MMSYNFMPRRPDNFRGIEGCVEMATNHNYRWNDWGRVHGISVSFAKWKLNIITNAFLID